MMVEEEGWAEEVVVGRWWIRGKDKGTYCHRNPFDINFPLLL